MNVSVQATHTVIATGRSRVRPARAAASVQAPSALRAARPAASPAAVTSVPAPTRPVTSRTPSLRRGVIPALCTASPCTTAAT
ncbi:hypothetical protein WY02_08090 [Pseudonocardia sp. AL041005-10]|nr:hypothetical protein [Pseudonocardia sp. AL041005-10]ALE78397.1 hypothetical protein WY02_08090 [Pseudonocardia sp. AL041005-10]